MSGRKLSSDVAEQGLSWKIKPKYLLPSLYFYILKRLELSKPGVFFLLAVIENLEFLIIILTFRQKMHFICRYILDSLFSFDCGDIFA